MYVPHTRLVNFRYHGPKESAKINYMLSAIKTDLDRLTQYLQGLQKGVQRLRRQIVFGRGGTT